MFEKNKEAGYRSGVQPYQLTLRTSRSCVDILRAIADKEGVRPENIVEFAIAVLYSEGVEEMVEGASQDIEKTYERIKS